MISPVFFSVVCCCRCCFVVFFLFVYFFNFTLFAFVPPLKMFFFFQVEFPLPPKVHPENMFKQSTKFVSAGQPLSGLLHFCGRITGMRRELGCCILLHFSLPFVVQRFLNTMFFKLYNFHFSFQHQTGLLVGRVPCLCEGLDCRNPQLSSTESAPLDMTSKLEGHTQPMLCSYTTQAITSLHSPGDSTDGDRTVYAQRCSDLRTVAFAYAEQSKRHCNNEQIG